MLENLPSKDGKALGTEPTLKRISISLAICMHSDLATCING